MQPPPRSPNIGSKPLETSIGSSIGIFLALMAALVVFSNSSTALLRHPDRAIGFGLLNGVDPARRFSIYVTLVAVVLGVWLACQYGSSLLRRIRPSWFLGVRSRLENDVCALFAAIGSVALVARVSADRLDRIGPSLLCAAGLGGVLVYALARRLRRRVSWLPRQFGSPSIPVLIVLLAWPASQISGVLGDVQGAGRAWLVLLGTFLLPLVYGLTFGYCLRWLGRAKSPAVSQAFALGAAPGFAFPSLCPVANEIQHALAQHRAIEPRNIALGLLAVLASVGAVLFWLALRGQLRVQPGRLLARWVYPAIIFGETLLSVYKHELAITQIDPLHDGEQITAVHQFLQFDKWPFVDIWPAHGLFDYIGALYSLVNGFLPLELTAWNGLIAALSATAAYALLANIGTPLFAFVVAALLPIEAVLPLPMYSFFYAEPGLLAVGLLACLVLDKPSNRRHVFLSLATFLCFFWTPTSGVASVVAVFSLIAVNCVTASDRGPALKGLAAFLATGAGVCVAYVLLLTLCGQPVLATLRLIRAFMQADPLIGGRPEVIDRFDAPAFVQYLILPGIGLVFLAQLARHVIDRRPLDRVGRLLGFLTLVSFVLFARTLTRHGIVERYQPFYFVLLGLCAWMPRRITPHFTLPDASAASAGLGNLAAHFWHRASARAWFCLGLGLYVVWLPQPSYKRLVFDAFPFHTWQAKESRFRGAVPTYPGLEAFLGATLGPEDTFLELLNMPLLYAVLDREVPGQFFLPTMFYATDSVQNSYLGRLEAFGGSSRVPVALLPDEQGFKADEIENTLRSYRIAEHVYRHYVRFGTIDGFDAWVSRARWDQAARNSKPRSLGLRDPSNCPTHSVKPPRLEAGVLEIAAIGPDPYVEDVAEVADISIGGLESHHAVQLSYRTSVAGTLQLLYRFAGGRYDPADSGQATLVASQGGEWRSVQVPIPPQADPQRALAGLRIDPPDGAELEVKDMTLVFGQPAAPKAERYVASMLPFFWGNFDEHRPAEVARVLAAIAVPREHRALSSFNLTFAPIADKSSGNYLKLCIRLPAADNVAPSNPWRTVDHPGSWQIAGEVTLAYGAAPSATFVFGLVQPTSGAPGMPEKLARSFAQECKPYLVRLSSQYAWSSQPVSSIRVDSSVPIVLESASVLAAD
jgi:hypothetical protein